MAGAGFKTFNTGDVLTASDVNTYLMQQTVMVFDDAAARTTALTGVVAEGMLSYLKDTNAVEVYDGSSWVASDDPNAIQNSIVDAKGDLISATADNTPARLAVGADNTVLTADSSTATGLKWAAAASSSGPAFSAQLTADQNPASTTQTKVIFNSEVFDTDGCYDPTTNYRFTPNKAGYYFINLVIIANAGTSAFTFAYIYKNGSIYRYSYEPTDDVGFGVSDLIYFNGTTDYVEAYVKINGDATRTVYGGNTESVFSGFFVRS